MEWSSYSQALFAAYQDTTDNLIVYASPGAGKTTNIKHLWSLNDKKCLYLVFNKHNQLEAEGKLPQKAGSAVKTLNSLGHNILLNNYGRLKLDDNKVRDIVRRYMPMPKKYSKEVSERQWTLIKAVQTAKMYAVQEQFDHATFNSMVNTYDLDDYEDMYADTVHCLEQSDRDTSIIDFNDQIRLPAIGNLKMPQFEVVLGDEAQDFSPIQALLVSKLHADRYVLVGDMHQSIYGFRGAMCDSMDYLRQHFSCVQLPLSITYRCPVSVVNEAYAIFPEIEAWDKAEQGVVRSTADVQAEQLDAESLVLCRLNAPLIHRAYSLLKDGVACHVRGRDIGQGIARLITQQGASSVGALLDKLAFWHELECAKARKREDDAKVQRLSDRYESALVFCQRCTLTDSPDVVIQQINTLFEQGRGVCLSTVHKAKGLEADKVVLLGTVLFAKFYGKQKHLWQKEQEKNIRYVAVTRARKELVYA